MSRTILLAPAPAPLLVETPRLWRYLRQTVACAKQDDLAGCWLAAAVNCTRYHYLSQAIALSSGHDLVPALTALETWQPAAVKGAEDQVEERAYYQVLWALDARLLFILILLSCHGGLPTPQHSLEPSIQAGPQPARSKGERPGLTVRAVVVSNQAWRVAPGGVHYGIHVSVIHGLFQSLHTHQ